MTKRTVSVFNPFKKYLKKETTSKVTWSKKRCDTCNALLYEYDESKYKHQSVRIKCRLCKEIEVI